MRTKLAAATALAGSLLFIPLMQGAAHSASAPLALSATNNPVTMVAHGAMHGGGAMIGGEGGGRIGGGGPRTFAGPAGPSHLNTGPTWRGDRFASRHFDRDDFRFHHRHGHFVNGVFVFDVGPGYAYNDCWWLRRRALATGSPYWWHRYELCVGYY
jgi:hypothetical protein